MKIEITDPTPAVSDRELAITRLVDAPPEHVFHAWTNHLARWWGPNGVTTTVREMDLRPGGAFQTVMRAPDGSEHVTRGVFLDVDPPRRIVFTDAFEPGWVPARGLFFTSVTTFEPECGGRTRYTERALHWTVEGRERHERMGFQEAWGESMNRLIEVVLAEAWRAS